MPRERSRDIEILDMPWPIAILAALSAIIVLGASTARIFYKPFRAPSASMEPAIPQGSYILVDKFAFAGATSPQRGDIVVFRPAMAPDAVFVKRVVAVGGDTVRMVDGALVLNGVAVDGPADAPWAMGTEYDGPRDKRYLRTETMPNGASYRVVETFFDGAPGPSPGDNTQTYVVPAGHVFVLGDYRDNSSDSRAEMGGFGYVAEREIVGKVVHTVSGRTLAPKVIDALRPY
jgi:signal peptidase I